MGNLWNYYLLSFDKALFTHLTNTTYIRHFILVIHLGKRSNSYRYVEFLEVSFLHLFINIAKVKIQMQLYCINKPLIYRSLPEYIRSLGLDQ